VGSRWRIRDRHQLRDENGKGTMGYGSEISLCWGLVEECEGKGRCKHMLFGRVRLLF